MSLEKQVFHWLERHASRTVPPPLGPGDDASVLAASSHPLVVTTDMLMDGTDFLGELVTPEQIAYKSLAVNLSDIAAMGCEPYGAFLSLALPRSTSSMWLDRFLAEIVNVTTAFQCPLLGGDTNVWEHPLAISVTMLGRPFLLAEPGASAAGSSVWLRGSAKVGDRLLVSGRLGGSILGHHLSFEPRLRLARCCAAAGCVHAAMDISDGTALDAFRMADASQLGVVIRLSALPISAAARELSRRELCEVFPVRAGSPWEHALYDGEDFELLLAVAELDVSQLKSQAAPADVTLTDIGYFVDQPGLWLEDHDGEVRKSDPGGFWHT